MNKVDFQKVRLVPFLAVLDFYKVQVRKRSNTQYVANCPLKSHEGASKEHTWTLAITTEKNGKAYCHSDTCRAASNKPKGFDVIDFVAMMDNTTVLDAAKKISELFAIPGGEGERRENISAAQPEPEATGGNRPLAFALKGLQANHPFILQRGITEETAGHFGVGFFPGKGSMANRVVFPLHENGNLIGYAGRTTLDVTPENPKWKLPLGLKRSFLYNLERCKVEFPLMLVESPWGVLWTFQHNIQAAALLGHSMSVEQYLLVAPFRYIRLAMDNDDAGREATSKIAAELLKRGHKVTSSYLKG